MQDVLLLTTALGSVKNLYMNKIKFLVSVLYNVAKEVKERKLTRKYVVRNLNEVYGVCGFIEEVLLYGMFRI